MIITRSQAIEQGLKYYFTGIPCPNGHTDRRKVHNSTCYTCAQESRTRCEQNKPRTARVKRTTPRRASALPHPEYQRHYRQKERQKVIKHLGGACVRCGFDDERALQIDHVNGGGVQELKLVRFTRYYKKVINDQTGKYQLLCANCNWIKRIENNECRQY